jgi:hypothetical protein
VCGAPSSPHFVFPIHFQHSLQTPALWRAGRTSCSLDSSRGPVRPTNTQLAYLHSRSRTALPLCTYSLGKHVPCRFARPGPLELRALFSVRELWQTTTMPNALWSHRDVHQVTRAGGLRPEVGSVVQLHVFRFADDLFPIGSLGGFRVETQ